MTHTNDDTDNEEQHPDDRRVLGSFDPETRTIRIASDLNSDNVEEE